MSNLIVGTAGHIDHGKTSLVRELTGVDLDRTPEEKKRGITINLGFTHLDVDERRISFIDMPGHEKLIRNMIAGASGIDAVLLCISATEGVMPQTVEHLHILNFLNIQHGIVALTMCDLADDELIEMAKLELEELFEGTFLEGAPILETAAGPNPKGAQDLLDALRQIPSHTPSRSSLPFRLPIDRVFIQQGFGSVVTGTGHHGSIKVGATVQAHPTTETFRIRTIHVHHDPKEEAFCGQRTALNLSGGNTEALTRGHVLVEPGLIDQSSILNVRLALLEDADLKDGMRIRLLTGSSEILAKIHIFNEDEDVLFAQIRTERPLIALPQDRFVLRRESPLETLGGGIVVDPWAQKARKKDYSKLTQTLKAFGQGDGMALLKEKGAQGLNIQAAQYFSNALLDSNEREQLNNCWTQAVVLDQKYYSPECATHLIQIVSDHLSEFHKLNPLRLGCSSKSLKEHLLPYLTPKAFAELIDLACSKNILSRQGQILYRSDFQIQLTAEQEKQAQTLLSKLLQAGLEGASSHSEDADEHLIGYLVTEGRILRIAQQLIHPHNMQLLLEKIREHFSKKNTLSPADFKELAQLSRKFAIPILEWLDAQGFTARSGNDRIVGKTGDLLQHKS